MTKRNKIIAIVAGSIGGLLIVLVVASVVVLRTSWFANFVREKIIATTEESTGGIVEIGSFQFDWTHLTVRIRNFVLHGTEPPGSDPLARIDLLELHLKLLASLKKAVDLQYLGVQKPQINFMVFADGKTNVPEPKIKKQPSQTSGLETVVDLAIGQFEVQNGLLEYSQKTTPFSARGENLRALLNYNTLSPGYQGNLAIDPLLLTAGSRPPLQVHVNVPVVLEKDAVRVNGAKLNTAQSQILLDAAVQNMNSPRITAHVNTNVSLAEMQQTFDLPIDTNFKGAPPALTAELQATSDDKTQEISLQTARIGLGKTTFEASGTLRYVSRNTAAQFNANLDLAELARLLKIKSASPSGALQLNGNAKVDARNNYAVDGTLNSHDLGVRSGTTHLSNIGLYSPFHADPYLISLDGLKLNAFGGSLVAKVFIEKMQQLSVEGSLRNFSIPYLAQSVTGKHLGYDGTVNGAVKAGGDLKSKGTTGYTALARLGIAPGRRGVPLSGQFNVDYNGARDSVDLGKSYLAMPNSRIDLSGSLNRYVDINLVSHNLNDFLPAANFGAAKPEASLPVSLQTGGSASVHARITGDLSAPHVTSHAELNNFALEQRSFNRFALDLAASPSGAVVQNGLLTRNAMRANFDASIGLRKWTPLPRSPLAANVSLRNGDIADLLSLAGESSVPATGQLTADVHINGTYGDPLGSANLQVVNGSAYQQPFDRLYANVTLADQLITLSPLELAAAGGRIDVNGTFQHPRDSFMVGHAEVHVVSTNIQLANIKPLQQQQQGVAGAIQLSADAAVNIQEVRKQTEVNVANISADVSARHLKVQNQDAGNLTLTARTTSGTVNYNVNSDFAGSAISISGHTQLTKDYPTIADASIQNLSVEKSLSIAGQTSIPARGTLSANAHVAGTLQSPNANLSFALTKAVVYQEAIDRLQASVQYSNTLVDLPNLQLDVPAGRLTASGAFSHPASDFNAGTVSLTLKSTDIDLSKIEHVEAAKPGLTGTLHLAADLSATLRKTNAAPDVQISNLNANLATNSLEVNKRKLGNATFSAQTQGGQIGFHLDSDIAQSQIHGAGALQAAGAHQLQASLTFANIRYINLAPFLANGPYVQPAFDALVEGQASVNGPLSTPQDLSGRLELGRLEARTLPQGSATGAPPGRAVLFHNEGSIIVALNRSVVNVQQFHLTGPGTNVEVGGTVNFNDSTAPLNVNLNANADLGVLQDIDREFYSSGAITLAAAIHGSFSQPLANGRLELKNANVNYSESPNGIQNGNGVILLNGTSASIQNLTGESGGGKIAAAGFVGYAESNLNFNLRATATRVRSRYSGVSVVSNATVTLTGNTNNSLLGGRVTIQRVGYQSTSDAGSMLTTASTPPVTPAVPSPLLDSMRLDIRITTAPNLRVVTTYADRLSVFADLTVRGTAARPGVLGYVRVTDGQLVFFGNTYTVNTGTISFYNPNAITPLLNVSLETNAQGVDVTIDVTGPIDNMKLNYRSDPPLTFQQIVQLLATNTTPADPTIAAHQPTPPQQSYSQMGESAILGQAVADPLASRMQRVFGITQFKIDPSFQGSGGQPSARVTLQQKIASNITFTYINDVTQSNSEIIRVQWDITPSVSAYALRDFNGNVSLNFGYRFKVR